MARPDELSTQPPGPPATAAPEDQERAAARRRSEARERAPSTGAAGDDARAPERGAHTGRARADVAARAFAALAENVRDYAVFLLDPDGVITFWGEGARLVKWWTKDEAEGAHLRLLYPPGGSNDGTAEAHLVEAAERGEYSGEGHRVRSDGSTFWAGVTLTALWDDDGTLLGFAKVTRDLTARRAADALLQAAAESAERARADAVAASAAKSGFLATMSHEIRTPINAVIGYHELLALELDGPLTAGQRGHLARASASARHLLGLVSEVLDFSRLEAEQVSLRHSVLRLGDVVAAALDLVAPQARARGLDLADAVSGAAAGLAAWGDEARVRQVLVNLLANAIKFTAAEGAARAAAGAGGDWTGRITVSAGTATRASPDAQLVGDGPWVYVRVEDTGSGIPAERLQAIFEAFVQADMALTRRHGGTGLGLTISRRLARLMGGDVTVRSEVGLGSTFVLWLPAAPVESLQPGGVEGHGSGGEAPARVGTARAAPDTRDAAGDVGGPPDRGPLRAVADALLGDLERVLHAYVARMRSDPATPSARRVAESEVEDHLATFLADLANALHHLEAARGAGDVPAGEPTAALRDSTVLQHVVAERHGAQRARLGWSEQEVRREFVILNEELADAVRRRAPALVAAPDADAGARAAERAFEVLEQFVAVAERVSLASYQRAVAEVGR